MATPGVTSKTQGVPFCQPIVAHEKSRSQYLFRTGLRGPGGNTTFPYKSDSHPKRILTQAAALAAAQECLAAEKTRLGAA